MKWYWYIAIIAASILVGMYLDYATDSKLFKKSTPDDSANAGSDGLNVDLSLNGSAS